MNVCMVTVQKCWRQMPMISKVKVFLHVFVKDPKISNPKQVVTNH